MLFSSPLHPGGLVMGAAVVLALLADRVFGEWPASVHPVVWMGKALERVGRHIAPATQPAAAGRWRSGWRAFFAGAVSWCVLAAVVTGVAWVIQCGLLRLDAGVQILLLAMLLKPMLAWRMLHDEVLAVRTALAQSLAQGRWRLARLVSRDVQGLDATQVSEGAIESLAENLNDSVVAPLFWFCLLGLPGAVLYRFANTADAMWGYAAWRNGRYWQWAGKWAARADDVLSWLPARITAALLLCCHAGWRLEVWRSLPRQARRTPSPNGGWPMAAMALLLGVRLGKPQVYLLNQDGRTAQAHDIAAACACGRRVMVVLGCGFAAVVVLMAVKMAAAA